MTEVTPQALAFREGMSWLGAAVNLIATDGVGGRHGMTVSAVCSVTDTPPTLLVCINRAAFAHDAFLRNGVLSVNVLGERQRDLSQRFARRDGEDRFADASAWQRLVTGAPCLTGAQVAFDCRIDTVSPRGSHSVLFCEVLATRLAETAAEGLIWFRRGFHGTVALPSG